MYVCALTKVDSLTFLVCIYLFICQGDQNDITSAMFDKGRELVFSQAMVKKDQPTQKGVGKYFSFHSCGRPIR